MGKNHTEDYKLSAVKYALRTDNQVETCEVFDCKRSSLQDWIKLYNETGAPVRKTRRNRSAYKVKREHIDFLHQEIKKKPDVFMADLKEVFDSKFPHISVSRVHIGRLLRDSNKTRKRLRKKHEPKLYRGKERNHKGEVQEYLKQARKYDLDKIICLDETAIYANMHSSYARCDMGKRCYVKSDDNKVFTHYSMLVAISNKKTIGWTIYEKGAVNADRCIKIEPSYPFYTKSPKTHTNMNIFALSQDPKEAAKAHGDKHVVKMILESCQMLYTAHWICAHPELLLHKAPIKVAAAQKLLSVPECISTAPKRKCASEQGYRPVHLHHPCTVWTRTTLANYMWLAELALAISDEYEFRFAQGKKEHSCKAHAQWLHANPPPLPDSPRTPFALAMPDEYKMPDPVASYIQFYMGSKKERGLTTYTRREPPAFLKGLI